MAADIPPIRGGSPSESAGIPRSVALRPDARFTSPTAVRPRADTGGIEVWLRVQVGGGQRPHGRDRRTEVRDRPRSELSACGSARPWSASSTPSSSCATAGSSSATWAAPTERSSMAGLLRDDESRSTTAIASRSARHLHAGRRTAAGPGRQGRGDGRRLAARRGHRRAALPRREPADRLISFLRTIPRPTSPSTASSTRSFRTSW